MGKILVFLTLYLFIAKEVIFTEVILFCDLCGVDAVQRGGLILKDRKSLMIPCYNTDDQSAFPLAYKNSLTYWEIHLFASWRVKRED